MNTTAIGPDEDGGGEEFFVEESPRLVELLEEAKATACKVFEYLDWSAVPIRIGHQSADKLPGGLALPAALAETTETGDGMDFNACTLRNIIDGAADYSIVVITKSMDSPKLPHIILHELCHIITMEMGYGDDEHEGPCSPSEEIAVDLMAYAIEKAAGISHG